jgi:REP element-mobilizing transposase RayT
MPDHVRIFIGQKPSESISELVKEMKNASNVFINTGKLSRFKFDWQNGYSVFSHSRSQVNSVCKYILNQKEHHRKKPFKKEFLKLCDDFGIEGGRKEFFTWFEVDLEK